MEVKHDKHQPQANSITEFVNNYYSINFEGINNPEELIIVPPLGFPTLHFHYGSEKNFYNQRDIVPSVFIGQATRHTQLIRQEGVKFIGVNFKPYGLYNLLGISPYDFFNKAVSSADFFGIDNINHVCNTLKTDSIESGIHEIEQLLLNFQNKNVLRYHYFDEIVDKIVSRNGLVNIKDVLNSNISRRTFQRYFHQVIGIPPKLFTKVLRHIFIVSQIYHKPNFSWNDAILDGFYYDYSHFSKDFISFTQHTPQKYLTLKTPYSKFLLSH